MTVAAPVAPLYATRPYGVEAIGWSPRALPPALFAGAPYDLAFVPGDNRYAWLAAAMRARWIVAFAGDRPAPKSWPVDELVPYPSAPAAWGDMVAALAAGPPPAPYDARAWPAPPAAPFDLPPTPYAVLHVGASSPLKQWPAARWAELAAWLDRQGIPPVWSAGRGEEAIVQACDPDARWRSCAGTLDLPQVWRLVAGARVVVAPDTGVAHLARVAGAPTAALFGPGSAVVTGAGEFWRDAPYRAVTVDPFPCRDQRVLFKREIEWVRRCGRSPAECAQPRCMEAIATDVVIAAVAALTARPR
jgi:ADP-heptose:LPS heptosyltransferase